MDGKTFFVDLTKCTACRGCQIACKQWKKLPAEQTVNRGSHQNPEDLSGKTIRLVRFSEQIIDGRLQWLFLPDQCRHCVQPPCQMATENEGAILHDEATGAVIYTPLTAKEVFQDIRDACPYDIPRQDPETGIVYKCDMCIDRVRMGRLPACVQSCPTGTMNFGERDEMLKLAEARLAEAQKRFPDAQLVDPDDVRVIFLAAFPPEKYHQTLSAYSDASPVRQPMTRKQFLAKLGRPVQRMTKA
ncbi:4Fe-4S dicluster domain-containing protein [Paucidesulfovibrio longus]|uniref:4Fe-4S dicluster domain-containing protein n=1 Tax=Paucidesulfovibrio longus TaxID=889 RepID=UPI0003B7171E|nr:4Fe-4S dicluster domain-containing protein [Paucidesulfovibrio longus]